MPSKNALIIADKCSIYLDRPMTSRECLQCEEMAINYRPVEICRYVDALIDNKAPKMFFLVYDAIMCGLLVGCLRRRDIIRITGKFKRVYDKLHALCGDGFSEAEMESIIWLAEDCNDHEIDAAIHVARFQGAHHAQYIKLVIDVNRRRATMKMKKMKQYLGTIPQDYVTDYQLKMVPNVELIQRYWNNRVASSRERVKICQAHLDEAMRSKGKQ